MRKEKNKMDIKKIAKKKEKKYKKIWIGNNKIL